MLRKTVMMLILLLVPVTGFAEDVYLDISATECTGGGAVDTNYDPSTRSCGSGASRVYAGNYPYEASQSLRNGDTLYIREGTYYENVTGKLGYMWMIGALRLSASNLTVQAYKGETVLISGGSSTTDTSGHTNVAVTIAGSNITVDGIDVFGNISFGGANNTLENCDLSGGWDHQANWTCGSDCAWPNVIRFEGSVNAHVYNCEIHDTIKPPGGGNTGNMSMITHEKDDNTLIENCYFHNPCSGCGHTQLKYEMGYDDPTHHGTGTHATYRYNVFEGPGGEINLVAGIPNNGDAVQKEYFYQNVFINSGANFTAVFVPSGTLFAYIYNNTFYNAPSMLWSWVSDDVYNCFNNITYNTVSGHYNLYLESAISTITSYINYNDYYGTSATWLVNSRHTSLSAWQTYSAGQGWAKDVYSITSSPGFLNASGTFSEASDFKRSSYPTNGRGGSWPSVMGAYITGNETIGTKR
jgi:hypothetical protein